MKLTFIQSLLTLALLILPLTRITGAVALINAGGTQTFGVIAGEQASYSYTVTNEGDSSNNIRLSFMNSSSSTFEPANWIEPVSGFALDSEEVTSVQLTISVPNDVPSGTYTLTAKYIDDTSNSDTTEVSSEHEIVIDVSEPNVDMLDNNESKSNEMILLVGAAVTALLTSVILWRKLYVKK